MLSTLESLSANGPYGFATRDFVFVDETRPTPPNGSFPGSPVRTLPTRVFYPVCSPRLEASPPPAQRVPVASGGPFPLLAYAHGLSSTGANARHFAEHLASHGYIIAVPLFPLSNWRAPGGSTVADLAHQPGDPAFVMQQVARLGGADADLAAAVDTQRRGILGLSGGGLTVLIGAYHPLLKIDGIQAAVAHAPLSCFIGPGLYGRSLPVLIITGSADELVPISGPERVFMQAPPPVVLVNLLGGTHTGFMNLEIPFVNNTDTQECERLLSLDPTAGEDQLAEDLTRGVGPDVFNAAGCSPPCAPSASSRRWGRRGSSGCLGQRRWRTSRRSCAGAGMRKCSWPCSSA
ncbi:alpha/beta hydrolase family protein [Cystobacter fuscus]